MLTVFQSAHQICFGFQSCFLVSTENVTWQEGMTYCNNLGMQSVSIQHVEKLQLVTSVLHKLKGKILLFNDSILISHPTYLAKGIHTSGLYQLVEINKCPYPSHFSTKFKM